MPGWPGGPCPVCGEHWPKNHLSCPNFCPPPTDQFQFAREDQLEPTGHYIDCFHCKRELRVHRKYLGQRIRCRLCDGEFDLELGSPLLTWRAVYANCPHCDKELRAATKYLGMDVACNFCGGKFLLSAPALLR